MFLKKFNNTLNATKSKIVFTSKWYERSSFNPLSYRKKWNAGRSRQTGRIILHTRQSLLRRVKLLKINYNFRSFEPGFVSTLKLVPFSNKLLMLVHYTCGSCTYFPALTLTQVFSVLSAKVPNRNQRLLRLPTHSSLILYAPMFRKLSNLELFPSKGSQYARSSGSYALIIKRSKLNHIALVKLPSGVRKFFSIYSTLLLGSPFSKWKRKLSDTRSGFWRSYGVKSKVRGVAMNPVDHPHGGRTKSIRYPRTPWGKTTKFK